jgi:hypothetical protein
LKPGHDLFAEIEADKKDEARRRKEEQVAARSRELQKRKADQKQFHWLCSVLQNVHEAMRGELGEDALKSGLYAFRYFDRRRAGVLRPADFAEAMGRLDRASEIAEAEKFASSQAASAALAASIPAGRRVPGAKNDSPDEDQPPDRHSLCALTEGEVGLMFDMIDTSGSGKISASEFNIFFRESFVSDNAEKCDCSVDICWAKDRHSCAPATAL